MIGGHHTAMMIEQYEYDIEKYTPVGFTITGMPSYVTFAAGAFNIATGKTTGTFTIAPLTTDALTPITITITLTDGVNTKPYTFIVTPRDNRPTFITAPPN